MQSVKLSISSSIANKHKICTYRDMANLSRYIFRNIVAPIRGPQGDTGAPPWKHELRSVKKIYPFVLFQIILADLGGE